MSYCRWSSRVKRDGTSDLYIYEDVSGGWTTHIAGNKVIQRFSLLEIQLYAPYLSGGEMFELYDNAEREYYTQPWAGETFNDDSLIALRERLVACSWLGFNFPDYVWDRISREEKGD